VRRGGRKSPGRQRNRDKRKGSLSTKTLSAAARKRSAPVPEARSGPEETLALVLSRLDDDKAADTVKIDLRGKTTLADYMVVASGRSHRHVGAIAEHLTEALATAGIAGVRTEGLPNCDWVLIDAGDVIIHVFRPEVRSFYNLEKMWARARRGAEA
jgi:ribosome-associated protein